MTVHPPGLFFLLCRDGTVPEAALAPLLARLPDEERYVQTAVRGGEGFDATRWPTARDAALASFVARRLSDATGQLARTLEEIDRAAGDAAALRALARTRFARMLAGAGAAGADVLAKIWPDATDADRAILDEPPWPDGVATDAHALALAHHAAADGLFAYHCHRGLPGFAADHAADLARRAIRAGALTVDELVAAAVDQIT